MNKVEKIRTIENDSIEGNKYFLDEYGSKSNIQNISNIEKKNERSHRSSNTQTNSSDILDPCTCEKFDCTEGATQVIEVPAGVYGNFKLYLCRNCVKKFRIRKGDENRNEY